MGTFSHLLYDEDDGHISNVSFLIYFNIHEICFLDDLKACSRQDNVTTGTRLVFQYMEIVNKLDSVSLLMVITCV